MKKIAITILLISAMLLSSCASAATATTTLATSAATTVAITTVATTPPTTTAASTTTAPTTTPTTAATTLATTQATTVPTTTANLANPFITVESTAQNYKVTFPATYASLFGTNQAEIEKSAKADGVSQVIFNQDNTFTLIMSKTVYQTMITDFRKSVDSAITELIKQFSTVKGITYNTTMTVFTIKVDAANFTEAISMIAVSFYMLGTMYQSMTGVDPKSLKVVVNFVDVKTGKVLKSMDSTQKK